MMGHEWYILPPYILMEFVLQINETFIAGLDKEKIQIVKIKHFNFQLHAFVIQ